MDKAAIDIKTNLILSLDSLKERTQKDLLHYHQINKYLFMTYDPLGLKALGRIIANKEKRPYSEVFQNYQEALVLLMDKGTTKENRINTYQHIYGYFKKQLTKAEKEPFFQALKSYREDKTSHKEVLALLKQYVDRFQEPYLFSQTIFNMDD